MFFSLGICHDNGNQTFYCQCVKEWEGEHCERPVNYCENVTCQNNGVCRSLIGDYRCECLGDSYSGRQCEIKSNRIAVHQAVSKSLSYIAILAITSVVGFIVMMDLLKYGFGIDPVREERQRLQQKKLVRKRQPPVIQRFIYVNGPGTPNEPRTTIQETAV